MKVVGRVSQWFDAKNFGFIHENRNGVIHSYFFHRKHLMADQIPSPGKVARFNIKQESKGPVAIDVEIFHSLSEMASTDHVLSALEGNNGGAQ